MKIYKGTSTGSLILKPGQRTSPYYWFEFMEKPTIENLDIECLEVPEVTKKVVQEAFIEIMDRWDPSEVSEEELVYRILESIAYSYWIKQSQEIRRQCLLSKLSDLLNE